jgi:hypothetical protein
MLALGLASVPFFTGLYEKWSEISVNLPQVESNTPIYIQARKTNEMPNCFGSDCDRELPLTNPLTNADPTIYTVKFCDIFRDPKRYDGKIIRIKAFYWQGIDTNALEDSACKEWMRPTCSNAHKAECESAFDRIIKVMDESNGSMTKIDVIGRYTDDIIDPDPFQQGRVHLFEIIELKTAKSTKQSRESFRESF